MSNIEGDKTGNVRPAKVKDKKRKIPPRSLAWEHFTYSKETKRATCIHCGVDYSADSRKAGTRNLNAHLKKCPKLANQKEINDDVVNQEQNEVEKIVFDQERNLELFAKMVIHGKIPLQYVENPLFTKFARSLQPMYIPVDRMAVEKSCLAYYENEKTKLQAEFFKLTSRVSFLVGIYHQQHKDDRGFICVTAHFINDDFKLVERIICFNEIHDSGNDHIVAEVERCLYGWGLSKKMLTCAATVDNSSPDIDWRSHISSVICGGEHINVELFAASLRVIASLVYEEVESHVVPIRRMIENIRDPMFIKRLNEIAEELSLPCKSELLIDHMSKWHSVLNMLRDALSYRSVLIASDYSFPDVLSCKHWNEVEWAVELLELIYSVMSSRPTSNLFLKKYLEIHDKLLDSDAITTWKCISYMKSRLRKFLVGCNKLLFVASVLDPRFKFEQIKRCYDSYLVKTEVVEQFLQDLCAEYEKVNNNSSNASFSHVANCSVILELHAYLQEGHSVVGDENVLDWWKDKKSEYPILSMMARDILAIPLSSSFLPFGFDSFKEFGSLIHNSSVSIKMTEALICGNRIEASEFLSSSCLEGKDGMFKGCRKLLAELIISSELPLTFVENPFFVGWTKFLQPLYIPDKQGTIRKECHILYENYYKEMDSSENKCISLGRLVSTEWIYIRKHFIDDDFNLVRRIIGVAVDYSIIEDYLDSDLPNVAVVDDNNYCYYWVGGYDDQDTLRCSVYMLGQIAAKILLYNKSIIKSIQRMICHIAKTPNALNTFNQIAVWNNVPAKVEFVLDNPERWDSSLDMLHDALIYKNVFDAYEGYDKNFCSCKKWEEVERIVKLLTPTYEAVIMLSSDKYATSNLILKTIVEIRAIFLEASTALERRLDIYEPLQILARYLKNCKEILLVASSILDPRFKLLYVEGTIRNFNETELKEFCEKYEKMISVNACTVDGSAELKRYLEDIRVNATEPNFNVLTWWKGMKSEYPVLSRMARDILAIPASSVLYQFAFTLSTAELSFGSFVDNDIDTFEASFCLKYGSDGLCLGQSSILKLSAVDSIEKDSRNKHVPSLLHGGLTIREIAAIEFVKKHIASPSAKILVIMKDNVLTAKMMECLITDDGPNSWIHDEVMDCCINILNFTDKQGGKKSSLVLSTSQIQWLCSLSMEEKVTSSIVETGKFFHKYEVVNCPIKINNHWFVVVVSHFGDIFNYETLKFKVSVDSSDHEIIRSLIIGIQKCILTANVYFNDTSRELHFEEKIDASFCLTGPEQKDCHSCDLYALKCMHLIWDSDSDYNEIILNYLADNEIIFDWQLSQKYINMFRKKLVAELIFSELNERTDIQKECLGEEKVHDFGRCRSSVVNLSAVDRTKKDVSRLSLQEIAAIEFVRKHTAKEVIKMDDIIVKTDKLKCLVNSTTEDGPDKWINDDVMNCYINILNMRRKPHTIIVNTLHSQWLCSRSMIKSGLFSVVEVGKSFLECKLVLVPINIQNAHWFVGIFNFEKKEFHILDSLMSMSKTFEITCALISNIQACIEAAFNSPGYILPEWLTKNILDWPVSVIPNIPQQREKSSCGLFALKYMELWNGSGLDVDFSQDDIDLFRNKLVAELIFSELNERKDIQNEINMSIQDHGISR